MCRNTLVMTVKYSMLLQTAGNKFTIELEMQLRLVYVMVVTGRRIVYIRLEL